MQVQAVSFGNNQQNSNAGNLFGAVKDSFLNVAATAALGGAAGGAVGKLASLTPYTPDKAALNMQYADMFQRALKKDEIPEHIKNAGDDFVQMVKSSKDLQKDILDITADLTDKANLKILVTEAKDEMIQQQGFQETIKNTLKEAADKIPEGGYTKNEVLERLKDIPTDGKELAEKIKDATKASQEKLSGFYDDFIKKAGELKDSVINQYAQDGAKHLRKTSIIGAGIAIGAMGALILNILKTYGIIGKKGAPAQGQAAQPQVSSPMLKTTQG